MLGSRRRTVRAETHLATGHGLPPLCGPAGVLRGDERQHIPCCNLGRRLTHHVKNTLRSYATAATGFGRDRTAMPAGT